MKPSTYELFIENTSGDVFRAIVIEVAYPDYAPDGVRSVADIMEVAKTERNAAHYFATFAAHRKPALMHVPSDVDFGRATARKSRIQKILDYYLERDRIEAARAA